MSRHRVDAIQSNSLPDTLLHSKDFKQTSILNKSHQGVIYRGTTINRETQVILKRYSLVKDTSSFKKELKVLASIKALRTSKRLPQLLSYKFDNKFGEVLMTDAGFDLQALKNKYLGGHTTLEWNQTQSLIIGSQILQALTDLHSLGYIHGDIKLDNICGKFDSYSFQYNYCLIDFGLVQKFNKDGVHISCKQNDYFRGNILFAGENAINLRTLSRKDDLESLIYLVAFLHNEMTLPWVEDLPSSDTVKDLSSFVINQRRKYYDKYSQALTKTLPLSLQTALSYVRGLEYQEEPDYAYVGELFELAKNQCSKINSIQFDSEGDNSFFLRRANNQSTVASKPTGLQSLTPECERKAHKGSDMSELLQNSQIRQLSSSKPGHESPKQHSDEIKQSLQTLKEDLFKLMANKQNDFGGANLLTERRHYSNQQRAGDVVEYTTRSFLKAECPLSQSIDEEGSVLQFQHLVGGFVNMSIHSDSDSSEGANSREVSLPNERNHCDSEEDLCLDDVSESFEGVDVKKLSPVKDMDLKLKH